MTPAPESAVPLVVLAAGGTGGHMFPAEALARALIVRGIRVALVTDLRGEAFGEALPSVSVYRIRASRLRRDLLDRIRSVAEMALGGFEARRLLRRLQPAVVVGFGGYPSLPTVLAAFLRKIPVILHEQNALLGRANRRLAPRADVVATSYEAVRGIPPRVETVLTGNPVRPAIRTVRQRPYEPPRADGAFSILVTGGSQGARIFSEVIPAAVALLPSQLKSRLRIVQQCRPEDIDAARELFRHAGVTAELSSFFNDVPERLAQCHLVIARSGASTVAELGVAARPAILVPYPFATDDHQTANAEAYARSGAAWVIGQRAFIPLVLAEKIEALAAHPDQLAGAAEAAREQGRPDAADRLAQLTIERLGRWGATPEIKGVAA